MFFPKTCTKALCLFLALLQFTSVNAYFIDDSCDSIRQEIIDSIDKSFNLASEALTALKEDYKNEHHKTLRMWFFRERDLPTVKKVYGLVDKFKTLDQASTDETPQPTIYCTLDRLEKRDKKIKGGGKKAIMFDTKNSVSINDPKGAYDLCHNGKVVALSADFRDKKKGTLHEVIQLCPWYLNEIGHSEFKNADGSLPDRTGKRNYKPDRDTSVEPLASVLSSRLDSVLLHELTHAIPDNEGKTEDFEYTWGKCINMNNKDKCMNADSYTQFALGVYVINKQNMKLDKEGRLVALDADVKKRWLEEQTVMRTWTA